jgi:hypothetical protein
MQAPDDVPNAEARHHAQDRHEADESDTCEHQRAFENDLQ